MELFQNEVSKDQEYLSHKVFPLLDSLIEFYNAQEEIEQNADKLFTQFLEKKGISQK